MPLHLKETLESKASSGEDPLDALDSRNLLSQPEVPSFQAGGTDLPARFPLHSRELSTRACYSEDV